MSKSFLIYKHLEPVIQQLSDKDAGVLFKAIFEYERTQKVPNLKSETNIVFTMVKMYLDNARDKYEQRCQINRSNAQRNKTKASDTNPIATNRKRIGTNNNNNNNIIPFKKEQWKGVAE